MKQKPKPSKCGRSRASGSPILKKKNKIRAPVLAGASEERWKQIAFEAETLDGLLAGPRTRKSVELAGTVLGWSTSKTYKLLNQYREAGHAGVLARTRPLRAWSSRLSSEQDEIIEKALAKFLKRHRGQAISKFVEQAIEDLKAAGVTSPSEKSIRRRFEALPERVRYAHWHGAKAAADRYNLERGNTPPTRFPLERVQIDHTPGDLWLLSDDYTLALGRPTVTLVIDEFSRIVLAINVTFGYPSIEELAETMAIACLPKEGWLKAMGIQGVDWPWFGIMAGIYVDRGVDFTSTAFYRGCLKWRIHLSHRSQPHHGGIIERIIRTAMEETKNLPGNTRYSKTIRQEDRVDPSKTAKLTLKEYLTFLVRYFVLEYPHRIHPALGMTPAEKWNLGVHQCGEPRRAEDPEGFYLDFLKGERRKLEKYGVMISYLKYRDIKLQPLLNHAKAMEVQVKRDPADVSRVFFEDPRSGSYLTLTNSLTQGMGICVAEWEQARKELKARLKGQQVTAPGILGVVQQSRAAAARSDTPSKAVSKLNRGKQRAEQRNVHRRSRANQRTPKSERTLPAPVPRLLLDPTRLTLFPNSGDAQ